VGESTVLMARTMVSQGYFRICVLSSNLGAGSADK
jgi:hypothetical protein